MKKIKTPTKKDLEASGYQFVTYGTAVVWLEDGYYNIADLEDAIEHIQILNKINSRLSLYKNKGEE